MNDPALSRRSFLMGVFSLTVVAASGVPSVADVPRIYADGGHCDADGLEALMEGRPFILENDAITAVEGLIRRGSFLLRRTLVARPKTQLEIRECTFWAAEEFDGDSMIVFKEGSSVVMERCILGGPRHRTTSVVITPDTPDLFALLHERYSPRLPASALRAV